MGALLAAFVREPSSPLASCTDERPLPGRPEPELDGPLPPLPKPCIDDPPPPGAPPTWPLVDMPGDLPRILM